MLKYRIVQNAAFLAFVLAAVSGHGATIAEDQFATGGGHYTAGSRLYGQDAPATGFAGAWTGGNGTTAGGQNSNNATILETNLTLDGVVSNQGGSVRLNAVEGSVAGSFNESRALSSTVSGDIAWFGFLVNTSSGGSNGFNNRFQLGLLSAPLATVSGADQLDAIMKGGSTGIEGFGVEITNIGTASAEVFLRADNGAAGLPAINGAAKVATINLNQTYFVLFSLQANTSGVSDTLNFWCLSSAPASQTQLGAPTFSVSSLNIVSSLSSLDTLLFATADPANQNLASATFDAVRLGDSYIAVVPEPSTNALILASGLLGFAVLGLKRYQKSNAA